MFKLRYLSILLLCAIVLTAAAGCGKKGPPMPPDEESGITGQRRS